MSDCLSIFLPKIMLAILDNEQSLLNIERFMRTIQNSCGIKNTISRVWLNS
ncbi:hypothetical protein GCM10011350_03940 [Marinomonas arctica]|nr:hypothetical protein GCM10011350_03940 [Marinomonas arctica]